MLSNLEEISWKNANKVFEDADGRIRLKRPEHFLNMTRFKFSHVCFLNNFLFVGLSKTKTGMKVWYV